MKYAKLIDGTIEFAPQNKGSIINYNVNVELMVADGYKEFVEVERPATNRNYHIEYIEDETNISESIVYDETQEEADAREAQERHERLQRYSMTKQDFFNYILKTNGFTYSQLTQIVDSNEDYQVAWNLCNRVFRGNTLLIGALQKYIPTLTDEELDNLFEKYGEQYDYNI